MSAGGFPRRDRKIQDPKLNDDAAYDLPQIVATVILEVSVPSTRTSHAVAAHPLDRTIRGS